MLEKLIQYFVYKTKGYITKAQLIKFLYLADLYAVKWTGKQLTELDWYYYHYAPQNENIDKALTRMDGKEILQEVQEVTILIKLGTVANNIDELKLPNGLQLILDNIRREWAGLGLDKLKQLSHYVDNTAPILSVKNHKPEEKVLLNLYLEQEKLMDKLGVYSGW